MQYLRTSTPVQASRSLGSRGQYAVRLSRRQAVAMMCGTIATRTPALVQYLAYDNCQRRHTALGGRTPRQRQTQER